MKRSKAQPPFYLLKFLCIACLFLFSCGSKSRVTAAKEGSAMQKQFDSLFNKLHADGLLNGNVLIASGDTVIYKGSFGLAEHTGKRALNDSSVFELASVSKQFTAMGIVLLKEKGKLRYEDSLRHFFPELPYQDITVKHLLQHTSGLPDYMMPVMMNAKPGTIATNADIISLLAKKNMKALFKPGEKWEYSNTGYAILASIIEKVSGKSYRDFLKENIFIPLGMVHTEVYRRRYDKKTIDNYAYGYIPDGKTNGWILPDSVPVTGKMVFVLDGIVGDGTVNSTAPDLLKWSLALDKHLLVPEKTQDEIFTPGLLNDGSKHSYGFGWMVSQKQAAGRTVAHNGGWPGYGTYIEKHIDSGKTIIILSNHDQPKVPFGKISGILSGIKEEEPKEIKMEEAELKNYEGKYELTPDFVITITVDKGKIYEQATGQEKIEIFPQKEDLFFLKAVEAQIRFERNDKKEVTGMVLLQNGAEMPGKKIK